MARPTKPGLDYFPFDVGFFEDEKIACIAGEFGIKGEIVAIKLLCAVYKNGYFIEWSDMVKYKLLLSLPGISAELFDQILNRLVRWGFFDASLFDSVKVLTSAAIQRRYFEIVKRRKQGADLPYLLVNVAETPVNVAESTQSKVNINKNKTTCVVLQKAPRQVKENSLFSEEEKKQRKRKVAIKPQPTFPTLEEVKKHFISVDAPNRIENWEQSAIRFYENFSAVGWRDKYNRLISRWDSRANSWILSDEERQKKEKQNGKPNTPTQRAGHFRQHVAADSYEERQRDAIDYVVNNLGKD